MRALDWVVQVVGRHHRQTVGNALGHDTLGAFPQGQPEGVTIVRNHKVERAISGGIKVNNRPRRIGGVGIIQRVQHQFAPAALAVFRPQRPTRLRTTATTPVSLSASQLPPASSSIPPIKSGRSGQWRAWGFPGTACHFVAVAAQDQADISPRLA